jgi:hypothetical protein
MLWATESRQELPDLDANSHRIAIRKRICGLVLVLLAVVGCSARATGPASDTLEAFGDDMSKFYLAPSEESFEALQRRADRFERELKQAGNGVDLLVAVMMARISAKHGWPVISRAFGPTAKVILDGNSPLARYVDDDSQVDPTKLDVWWVSFFATSDQRYLENLLRFAGVEAPANDVKGMLVVRAATWSFNANCRQHWRVQEFARIKLRSGSITEPQKTFLQQCVSSAVLDRRRLNSEYGRGPMGHRGQGRVTAGVGSTTSNSVVAWSM